MKEVKNKQQQTKLVELIGQDRPLNQVFQVKNLNEAEAVKLYAKHKNSPYILEYKDKNGNTIRESDKGFGFKLDNDIMSNKVVMPDDGPYIVEGFRKSNNEPVSILIPDPNNAKQTDLIYKPGHNQFDIPKKKSNN
jgi:hypothetical protein